MTGLAAIENMIWIKDYLFIRDNDDNDSQREFLNGQLKMAINNVTAIQLKLNTIHGTYNNGIIFWCVI